MAFHVKHMQEILASYKQPNAGTLTRQERKKRWSLIINKYVNPVFKKVKALLWSGYRTAPTSEPALKMFVCLSLRQEEPA